MSEPLIDIAGVEKTFRTNRGTVRALDGVDMTLQAGATLALVGESGSGKSTLARCVLQLERPDAGTVLFEGRDITGLRRRELKHYRRQVQMVFQDPLRSLNPRMRVEQTLAEPLKLHTDLSSSARRARVSDVLSRVGLGDDFMKRYPGQMSGGQQQRVAIARALITEPQLIVLDEPTAALDARVRLEVNNLLRTLQQESGIAYLLISHDLASVQALAHDVSVMYLGRIVERAPTEALFEAPRHPYSVALFSAAPRVVPRGGAARRRMLIRGEVTAAAGAEGGCVFRTRCPMAVPACAETAAPLVAVGEGRLSACIRHEDVADELSEYVHAQQERLPALNNQEESA